MRPRLFYALFVVSRIIISCYIIRHIRRTHVSDKVALDKWLPLKLTPRPAEQIYLPQKQAWVPQGSQNIKPFYDQVTSPMLLGRFHFAYKPGVAETTDMRDEGEMLGVLPK